MFYFQRNNKEVEKEKVSKVKSSDSQKVGFFDLLFMLAPLLLLSQSNIPASGGEASGSGKSSFSVGQVFYTESSGGSGYTSSLGVQQPYEISIVLSTPDFEDIALSLAAFPNPTTDILNLNTPDFTKYHLSYSLYDINGRQIESKKIRQNTTIIHLKHLQSAVYILNISDTNRGIIKTFRIVKN